MKKKLINAGVLVGGIILSISPIIWIWFGWSLFWRLALTGLFILFMMVIFKSANQLKIK